MYSLRFLKLNFQPSQCSFSEHASAVPIAISRYNVSQIAGIVDWFFNGFTHTVLDSIPYDI